MHIPFIDTLHELVNNISLFIVLFLVAIAIGSIYLFMRLFDSDFKQLD